MGLREYEDWILLLGAILAAVSGLGVNDARLALVFMVLGAIGKALLSIVEREEKK